MIAIIGIVAVKKEKKEHIPKTLRKRHRRGLTDQLGVKN